LGWCGSSRKGSATADVTTLAGTDANQASSAPASPPYGTSLHHELELLVDTGISPADAVRSATTVAAQQFGLYDRGAIAAGQRADLVLIDGDPLRDISAVRQISGVWCAGVPVADTPGTPGGRIPGTPRPGGVIVIAATAITNVRVFDGERLSEPATIVLEETTISACTSADGALNADVVDGGGGTLLPGLIDTHVHVDKVSQLEASASWGVTTMLDMGNKDLANLATLKNGQGLPTLRSASNPASAPNWVFVRKMGFSVSTTVTGPEDAARFVAERVAEGSAAVDHASG
jgi:imidazolonepropionase-like amidohydrolase